MDTICQEIGISAQHISETSVSDRYQLICDQQWLQTLEQKRKISDFPTYPQLDKRAHPTGPLEHPWTRILVQNYRKQPQQRVFPLPRQSAQRLVDDAAATTTLAGGAAALPEASFALPLTYSQAVAYVANVNFRNLWQAAYKKYQAAQVKYCKLNGAGAAKSPGDCQLLPYDIVLKELIQRIFNCPVIHSKLDRLKEGCGDVAASTYETHTNVLPALVAIETSAHISVFFYPPAIVTNLYDCITYSPAILGKSYNKPLFMIYQLLQLSKTMQSLGLFLGDIRLQDILMRDNLWLQVVPAIEANILLQQNCEDNNFAATPSEAEFNAIATDEHDIDFDDADVGAGATIGLACAASAKFDLKFAYDLDQFSLREYCEMWCNGQLSNFDYLTILNNAAGRSMHNPAYHHIMPWVTDFTARNGTNWRDLGKSKYRLNKGDVHLDLMFSHATAAHHQHAANVGVHQQQVPHHVSDFLSEITYFVYMARRTAQHVLCEHVRPIWVPAEYPVSIQRLQEWTPDECIPAFYADPMIFKSIHEDLPDLELPVWATCPEDFICKHREALESQYVSERLQHWIDLNFGYKLTGKAAIKSKNVCLTVVDQHKQLCQRGIVQLFMQPHPPKRFATPWFGKTAPRLQHLYNSAHSTKKTSNPKSKLKQSTAAATATNSNEQLQTSDNATATPKHSPKPPSRAAHNTETPPPPSSTNFYQSTNFIELPRDYNPTALLQGLETMQSFFARTFPKQQLQQLQQQAPQLLSTQQKMANNDLLFEENSEEHSFTNQLFDDELLLSVSNMQPLKGRHQTQQQQQLLLPSPSTINYMKRRTLQQQLLEKRERELQVMGCLIVELFLMPRLRPLLTASQSFEERLQACRTAAEQQRHELPKCLRSMVRTLLQLDGNALITAQGLPAPTAAQLLEPLFANTLIPFPNSYYAIYALIRAQQSFDLNATLLALHTHFTCNGKECGKYSALDRRRVLFERKLAECKVMSCCAHIAHHLLEPIAYEQFSSIELLLPHIIDLLNTEPTAILTAWHLFDEVAQSLGRCATRKHLLVPIMKLYDVESFDRGGGGGMRSSARNQLNGSAGQLRFSTSSSFKSRKSVKLYHHSFLLRLIVRFGLRCFLQNFIAPLIEAVGGYKEPDEATGLHYHSSASQTSSRRTSKNLHFASSASGTDDAENSLTLMSDVNETELDDATLSNDVPAIHLKQEIEDVFSFDEDATSDRISNAGTAENKSLDSFEMRAAPAEEAKEDDGTSVSALETTPEKLAISEIIYGQKLSNASFEDADKISLSGGSSSSRTANESPNGTAQHMGPKSPTIAIPSTIFRRTYQLNTIDCDIGSRKSIDSFEIITQAVAEAEEQKQQQQHKQESQDGAADVGDGACQESQEASDSLQASVISKLSEAKAVQNNRISEMSAESLLWLAHRLGPVLTSRYITRNLLRMLSLCYVGQENLLPQSYDEEDASNLNYFSIADAKVVGDRSAARVLECLMSIAAIFGEQIILQQYFPHISELIGLCQKRITLNLEGALLSVLQLLKYLVPCLVDATLMDRLKDIILETMLLPVVRLLGSTRLLMPSGYLGRSVLARKWLDAVYAICVRIGPDMSRELICQPALRQFFLIFDKAYAVLGNFQQLLADNERGGVGTRYGISPPNTLLVEPDANAATEYEQQTRETEELRDVFGPALAHAAYLSFLRFLGESIMQRTLMNLEFVLILCHEYEQPNYENVQTSDSTLVKSDNESSSVEVTAAVNEEQQMAPNSFGTNIIGNRIEVASPSAVAATTKPCAQRIGSMEVLDMVAYKFEQLPCVRHLQGNWLAYWRHELSRPDKDTTLNLQLKQIKLQTFVGHTNSVRSLIALDNENSFMSASKDKTVKLWSLRSEGDGKKITHCQYTYTAHKKSIHSLAFLEAMRLVVSCDAGVHIWDPFIGRPLGMLDAAKHNPVTVVKCLPSPSPLIVAGTAESSVRIIDARCMQYVNEWRLTPASVSNATVRCLSIAPSGNWLAVGLSSGSIVQLDTRTGLLLNSWRPMECDLLQLTAANDQQLISSALDHSLAVWHANDGILHYQLKPPPEPAHFLQTFGSELVFATTGNRIGIYSDLSNSHAAYSVTKLRSETFRGVLTSLAVLPLNRTFLAGNESGNIVLLC